MSYAPRSLKNAKKQYTQIGKEMLAIVYEEFHTFINGRQIVVQSNRKPLESTFKKYLHTVTMIQQ